MKKVIVMLFVCLLVFVTESYGAVSDDVYLRRDVFDAKMETMNGKLDMILEQLRELRDEQKAQRKDINDLSNRVSELAGRVEGLDKRIDGLDKRIDGLDKRIDGLDKRIESVDKRIDDLRNGIYLWLVAIGLFVSWPKVKESAQKWVKPAPSITLEDVKRLIEEHDMKLSGKPQA